MCNKNKLFFHSISCKNNGFLFTTPNIKIKILNLQELDVNEKFSQCRFSIVHSKKLQLSDNDTECIQFFKNNVTFGD